MTINLPTELLRSFVAVAETGSMNRAAERVCITQSGLSLQMKRLADIAQVPIFSRHRRGLVLTRAGEELLVYARGMLELNDRAIASIGRAALTDPVRLGIVQDLAEPLISGALVRFLGRYPQVRLQVRVASTVALATEFAAGLLDIMVGIGDPSDPDAAGTAPMVWCGGPGLEQLAELPLAIMESPCMFRDAALASLAQARRPYRIMLETPSVGVLNVAVAAGLAVTCRLAASQDEETGVLEVPDAPLPHVAFLVRTRSGATPVVLRLSVLLREALALRDET